MDEKIKPMAMRRMTWDEVDSDGKIRYLKEELKRTQKRLSEVCEYLNKVMSHTHIDNKMYIKMQNKNEESYGGFYFRAWEDKN